ncbi:MAG: HlyD family efflux transporter periplasmic adaptor subunit [Tissierellia bacterium]|nr:HlyD family efflux transporter periplasmic adaptor subunit [Tissierellia bacterium]
MKIKEFLKKHKKKLIVAGVALIAGLIFLKVNSSKSQVGTMINVHETVLLEREDFLDSVLENGKVLSEDSVQVYSKLQLPVKEILVEVGDHVEEGDIIARLDTENIQKEIDLKTAQMNQQGRASQGEIKNANERLAIALRNKKDGTNPQVVSAKAQADSAYEQWQSALKTYEDFKRSIEQGYNDQIISLESQKLSLKNSVDSSELSLKLAKDRKDKANSDIERARSNADKARMDRDYLKSNMDRLEYDISSIKREIEGLSSSATTIQTINDQLVIARQELASITDPTAKTAKEAEIASLESEIKNLEATVGRADALTRNLENLTNVLTKVSQDYQTAEADYQKYKAEYEGLEKSLSMNDEEVIQAQNALDIAKKNLEMADVQEFSSSQSREDMLRTYKNTADIAEKTYKSALENVKIAEISQDDEIKSLSTSLGIIKAGADNSMSKIDLQYLSENLEDAVIKAPISGTITENNMIIGSVPTNYVAKIETVERVIVKSSIKEYDLYRVKPGVEVEITSNVVGKDKIYKGRVETVSPTPMPNAGNIQTTEVVYEVKINIEDGEEALIPGMTVRTRYIIDRREDVYVVPTNCVYEKNKKAFLLAIKDTEKSTIEEIPVTIITENDFEYVIEFENEPTGIRVLTSPDKYSPGTEIILQRDEPASENPTEEATSTEDKETEEDGE